MSTRKRPAGAASRLSAEDIFRKAADIFHAKGYDATSMDDLARALDVTKAGLYYYIESKEDLLFAIMSFGMDWLDAQVIAPARAEPDPERRLRVIIGRHGSELLGGIRAITILSEEVAALVPKHRRVILERKRAYLDLVRGTLDELKAAGRLRDVDTTVAAFCLFGTLMWLPRWYRSRGRLSTEQVIEEVNKLVLNGLLTSAPSNHQPAR